MAFVSTPSPSLRVTSFFTAHVDCRPVKSASTARISMEAKEKSPSMWSSAGETMFKENIFTGGMPGGEAFYRAWLADGMSKEMPDVPASSQPSAEFKEVVEIKTGISALLDRTEFFKGFTMPSDEPDKIASEDDEETEPLNPKEADDAPPDPALYEMYYPTEVRNKAPEIKIEYYNDYLRDNISMAMTEVSASFTDLYFPKDMKNRAPVIDVCYHGSLAHASVTLTMKPIFGPPTLPPPPKQAGDIITKLVPGVGGGLKLEFDVAGEQTTNV